MTTDRKDVVIATMQLAQEDARDGREPLWYRVGASYLSAETGHIGPGDVGAAYVTAYAAERKAESR